MSVFGRKECGVLITNVARSGVPSRFYAPRENLEIEYVLDLDREIRESRNERDRG